MASRVAVIEDDPGIGSMLNELLKQQGFDVAVIPDGRQGIEALRESSYQAVILDVMLPGKDGIAVLEEIRAAPATQELPVIMLTARADDATTWAGWKAGVNYFISKPFDPEDVIRLLHQLIG